MCHVNSFEKTSADLGCAAAFIFTATAVDSPRFCEFTFAAHMHSRQDVITCTVFTVV